MDNFECEICVNIEENSQNVSCLNCGEKNQCIFCIINNDNKCCFCTNQVNIYTHLLLNYKEDVYNKIQKMLFNKIHSFACESFYKIFSLNLFFSEWILSNNYNVDDLAVILRYFNKILSGFINKNKIPQKIALKQMLVFLPNEYEKIYYQEYITGFNKVIYEVNFSNDNLTFLNIAEDGVKLSEKNYVKILPLKIKFGSLKKNKFRQLLSLFLKDIYLECVTSPTECSCNDISCLKCNTKYCPICLLVLENGKHECELPEDTKNSSIKLCPGCKTLITKESGCDDMWCINCEVFFSWKRGTVYTDYYHNPDFIQYKLIPQHDDRDMIKQLIINDIINKDNGIGNVDNVIIQYFTALSHYDEKKCFKDISNYVVPKMLKQSLILNILQIDTIKNRSLETIIKLFDLCNEYKRCIVNICGEHIYENLWETVEYDLISVHTSYPRIIYKHS